MAKRRENHQTSATVNATGSIKSDSPQWNEVLLLQVDEDYAQREGKQFIEENINESIDSIDRNCYSYY